MRNCPNCGALAAFLRAAFTSPYTCRECARHSQLRLRNRALFGAALGLLMWAIWMLLRGRTGFVVTLVVGAGSGLVFGMVGLYVLGRLQPLEE